MEVVGKKLKIQRPIDHLHPKVDSAGASRVGETWRGKKVNAVLLPAFFRLSRAARRRRQNERRGKVFLASSEAKTRDLEDRARG